MNLTFGKAAFLPLQNMTAVIFVNAAGLRKKKKKHFQGIQADHVLNNHMLHKPAAIQVLQLVHYTQ